MAEGYAEQYEQTIQCGHVGVVPHRERRPGRRHVPGHRGAARPHRRRRPVPAASPRVHRHARGARRRRRDAGGVRPGRPGVPAGRTRRRGVGRAARCAVPPAVRDLVGLFLGQLDFCRRASDRLEYPDEGHAAPRRPPGRARLHRGLPARQEREPLHADGEPASRRGPRRRCCTSRRRSRTSAGAAEVGAEDVRAVLPWVLHDKLPPNPQSPFFQKPENRVYLTDRVSWLWQLFDRAVAQQAAYAPDPDGGRSNWHARAAAGFAGVSTPELRPRLDRDPRPHGRRCSREMELNAVDALRPGAAEGPVREVPERTRPAGVRQMTIAPADARPVPRRGPARFSRWDAAVFDAVASGPAAALAGAARGQPDADATARRLPAARATGRRQRRREAGRGRPGRVVELPGTAAGRADPGAAAEVAAGAAADGAGRCVEPRRRAAARTGVGRPLRQRVRERPAPSSTRSKTSWSARSARC